MVSISDDEVLSIIRDVTQIKTTELYSIIHRELGFVLGTITSIKEALIHINQSMLQIKNIDASGIYLINQKTGELELNEHEGFSAEYIISIRNNILEQVYSHSVYTNIPVYGHYHEIFKDVDNFIHAELKQFGVIPIKHEGMILGAVIIASRMSRQLQYESKVAIETIAAQIGGTIARIKSEEALAISQRNFQSMFDTISDFTLIVNESGRIILANPIVEQIFGFSKKELNGLYLNEIYPVEAHGEIRKILEMAQTKDALVCSVPMRKRDGELIPVETKVVKGNWDGANAFYFMSRDISERKKAESKLKMQSLAFEAFTLPIIITDIKGNIQWTNTAFLKHTGYQESEIIGKNPRQIIKSGVQDPEFYKNIWNHILNGKVWSGELINKRKDESLFSEELTITPVTNQWGEVTNFIAIKIDITGRKEMEIALKKSEERWYQAIEASGNGVWDWNLVTNEIFFSDQWRFIFGYSGAEINNRFSEWEKLVHPDDLEGWSTDLKKIIDGKTETYIKEYRMRCNGGKYIWILDRAKIIDRKKDGTPSRIIGTHKDITNKKNFEEQLIRGIEKEKELNELKSRFVATTSHEFRTPLASILIISDTLILHYHKMNSAQLMSRLHKIKSHILHLTDIVNNVLQLSRMQEGKIGFKPQIIDLVAICQKIIDGFISEGLLKNKIELMTPFQAIFVSLDELLVNQSITNLISNAVKYSNEAVEIVVRIELQQTELILSVEDKGIGVPEEDIKHLFTPFFRARNASTIHGHGLGLCIVRESLLLHGGTVSCSNNEGKGSTFRLHFPNRLVSRYSFHNEI